VGLELLKGKVIWSSLTYFARCFTNILVKSRAPLSWAEKSSSLWHVLSGLHAYRKQVNRRQQSLRRCRILKNSTKHCTTGTATWRTSYKERRA